MRNSPSQDELTVMHQFDRLCQLALDGEAANYYRHMEYQRSHDYLYLYFATSCRKVSGIGNDEMLFWALK